MATFFTLLQFFLKATQLDQVSNDYREIMLNKGITEQKVDAQSTVSISFNCFV